MSEVRLLDNLVIIFKEHLTPQLSNYQGVLLKSPAWFCCVSHSTIEGTLFSRACVILIVAAYWVDC